MNYYFYCRKDSAVAGSSPSFPIEQINNRLIPAASYPVTLTSMNNVFKGEHLDTLPFIIASEEALHAAKEGGESELFLEVPRDTVMMYSINRDDPTDYQVIYKKDHSTSYPAVSNVPSDISEGSTQFEKVCTYYQPKGVIRRALLIIRSLKNIIKHFNPAEERFYEIKEEGGVIVDQPLPVDEPVDRSTSEPMVVILHGFMSLTEHQFHALKRILLQAGYYGKVFGYSYATNRAGIRASGGELYHVLYNTGLLQKNCSLDMFAHSQGGLIARSMVGFHLSDHPHSINDVVLAGVPNKGTPLAVYGATLFSIHSWNAIELLFHIVRDLIAALQGSKQAYDFFAEQVTSFHDKSPALHDMSPGSEFLENLNAASFSINGNLYVSGYHLPETEDKSHFFLKAYRRLLNELNVFIGKAHDGVVPQESSYHVFTSGTQTLDENEGWHSWYFGKADRAAHIWKAVLEGKP
ncbi:triacylglycerol lipase [Thalassobacillus sp. CUG 92003]|uniref:esterase/lipase family protein n=1 Tax=Thalassobacillus sp. CUG 92003 TaxID=2736641 RepID=UPI0015E797D9|nr:hypothetical protein [Thalassobacillus sp. CUG 92003]